MQKINTKLPQIIDFIKKCENADIPIRLDVSIDGGVVNIILNDKNLNLLQTYESAVNLFKDADRGSASFTEGVLREIPWTAPPSSSFWVYILNIGVTNLDGRNKMLTNMTRIGYRPLTLSELIAFAIANPHLNKLNEVLSSYTLHTVRPYIEPIYPTIGWSGTERILGAAFDEENYPPSYKNNNYNRYLFTAE